MDKKVLIAIIGGVVVLIGLVFLLSNEEAAAPTVEDTATTTDEMKEEAKPISSVKPILPKPVDSSGGTSAGTPLAPTAPSTAGAPEVVIKDACGFLSPLLISQNTGIAVEQGASQPGESGSVCEFNSESGSKVVLRIGRVEDAPAKSAWARVVDFPGVGDEAYYQTPEFGSANGLVKKGIFYAQVSLYKSSGNLTEGGVKSLLSYLGEQL